MRSSKIIQGYVVEIAQTRITDEEHGTWSVRWLQIMRVDDGRCLTVALADDFSSRKRWCESDCEPRLLDGALTVTDVVALISQLSVIVGQKI